MKKDESATDSERITQLEQQLAKPSGLIRHLVAHTIFGATDPEWVALMGDANVEFPAIAMAHYPRPKPPPNSAREQATNGG